MVIAAFRCILEKQWYFLSKSLSLGIQDLMSDISSSWWKKNKNLQQVSSNFFGRDTAISYQYI